MSDKPRLPIEVIHIDGRTNMLVPPMYDMDIG